MSSPYVEGEIARVERESYEGGMPAHNKRVLRKQLEDEELFYLREAARCARSSRLRAYCLMHLDRLTNPSRRHWSIPYLQDTEAEGFVTLLNQRFTYKLELGTQSSYVPVRCERGRPCLQQTLARIIRTDGLRPSCFCCVVQLVPLSEPQVKTAGRY
jgi:hypothetical protein